MKLAADLCNGMRERVTAHIAKGHVPESWDGHELRCLVADLATDNASTTEIRRSPRSARSKDFKNHMLVTPSL